MPIDRRMEKMQYIYKMEYYSAIKRNEIGSFVETWMDVATVIHTEVSQKEKNKYCVCVYIYIYIYFFFFRRIFF